MKSVLAVIRWILHKLFILILASSIWFMIPLLAFSVNLTDQDQVKSWLVDASTYDAVLDKSLTFVSDENEQNLEDKTGAGQIDGKALLEVIKPAIPASFLQTQFEGAIDGIYGWLDGTNVEPDFSISLDERKPQIEAALKAELTRQINELPECDLSQITLNFDIFEAECRPPGVPLEPVIDQAINEMLEGEDSVFDDELTGEDLNLNTEVLVNGPVAYDTAQLLPWMYWLTLIGFGALTILTSKRWQRGFKEVGITIFSAAGFLTLFSFFGTRLSNAPGQYVIDQSSGDSQAEAARAIGEPLAQVVSYDLAATSLLYSFITLLIGAGVFFIGYKYSPKEKKAKSKSKSKKKKDKTPEFLKDDESQESYIDKVEKETKKSRAKKKPAKKKKPKKLVQ